MFSSIVVGTDGSDSADQAVDLAISLARENKADLHIVNAYRTSAGAGQVAVIGAAVIGDDLLSSAVGAEASQRLVGEASERTSGLNVKTHSINDAPAEAVLRVAEEVGADLIVVGSKGMQRRVFGSVPNTIAHKAPCALLIAKTT